MIKRKKDSGFTLIELMIVIAVIGILAVVLVPKVGTIKTQAKMAGIDTNIRAVEAYVQSRISSWSAASTTAAAIATDINNAFSGSNALVNPLGGTPAVLAGAGAAVVEDLVPGEIYVKTADSAASIIIDAYDSTTTLMPDKKKTLTP